MGREDRIKILVLDDDDAVRISLESFFEDCGYTAYAVASAEEALEFLVRQMVDLVIVDLRLPGIDGISFIRIANEKWEQLRYIIFTGSVEVAIPENILGLKQVSKNILIKPVDDLNVFRVEISDMLNIS